VAFQIKKGTKIVIGYRSLIDWYSTGNWSGWSSQNRKLTSTPTKWIGTGPQAIPGKGAKLPGAKGAAWNVQDFDVPTARTVTNKKGQERASRKHVDIADNLGSYTPQWVYMMAENLERSKLVSSPSVLKNLIHQDEETGESLGTDVGTKWGQEQAQDIAWKAIPKGTTAVNLTYAKTYGEATLNSMGDKEGLPQLFGYLETAIRDRFIGSAKTLKEVYKGTSWEMKEYGGATGQEKLAEIVGAGEVEVEAKYGGEDVGPNLQRLPDPSSKRRGANPVDITFKRTVKIEGRGSAKFKRADVTTASYSSSKGHHGIGPKSKRVDDINKSIKAREKNIKTENNMRIKDFNKMITTLHSLYGTTDPLELRERISTERLGGAKWHLKASFFTPPPTTPAELQARRNAVETKSKKEMNQQLADALGVEITTNFNETIEWVLHALGNVVSGEKYWANIMAIDMVKKGDGLGTLIIRYSFEDNGEFQRLKVADVFILDYGVERFIFNQGLTDKSELAFRNALERTNAATITEGFSMISNETNLMRQDGESTRLRQTAHLAMPVAGEFAENMDTWTFALVDSIVDNAEHQLNKDFLSQATTFSKKMRADAELDKIKSWMEAISESFLGISTSASQIKLDFLWSAPYIASVEKQAGAGGASQFEGSF
jgi:hypothetical protein